MKRLTLAFVIIMSILLCSCSMGGNDTMRYSNREIADNKFNEVLEALHNEDAEMLTSLFSKETVQNTESFDESVVELFNYFNGKTESYDNWGALTGSTTRISGRLVHIIDMTYDVKTTECDYRFAIRFVSKDSRKSNNIGIQSLYVIKSEDDTDLEYAYWGDYEFTPGINIGIPNAE